MEKYEKESFIKKEIIEQSRHIFVYGYQNEKREQFARELERENPIQMNRDNPFAIYLEDFALKKEDYDKKSLDQSKIQLISNEYLHFSIGHKLVQKTIEDIGIEEISKRITKLLERMNLYSKSKDYPNMETVKDLERVLEESREFYRSYFKKYIHQEKTPNINEVAIPFILLESFVEEWKKALNNSSYLCVLIDKKEPIEIESTRAVNFLVGGRINSNISMKVITNPEDWDSYRDQNGQVIEYIHDYGIVELDDSNKKYIKERKEGW